MKGKSPWHAILVVVVRHVLPLVLAALTAVVADEQLLDGQLGETLAHELSVSRSWSSQLPQ